MSRRQSDPRRRLLWFVGLWLASLVAMVVVAHLLRGMFALMP